MSGKRWVTAAAMALLTGCATQKMSGEQLARVAKDWSLGIRASQVIPVYPLTEDLQPGDVFLVQTPIEEQVKVYLDKGFLPLENLVARLPLSGYETFYSGWPDVKDADRDKEKVPPRLWQFPKADAAGKSFSNAPLAAFPTYNFSVSRSEGLNVAIPVQSVPIGLNLLDSASANGVITLKDAYTYALPGKVVFDAIMTWSNENRDYLRQFGARVGEGGKGARYSYLRVVNRVYLVQTVNVSLFSNQATGVSASAGVPKPVDLLNLGSGTEASAKFDAVNGILSKASPQTGAAAPAAGAGMAAGGSVKLAMAAGRSVSLVETFSRPLVIGYMAFDYPIQPDGSLGPSVATFAALEGRSHAEGTTRYEGCDADCARIEKWLNGNPDNYTKLVNWLKQRGIDKKPPAIVYDAAQQDVRAQIVKEVIPK